MPEPSWVRPRAPSTRWKLLGVGGGEVRGQLAQEGETALADHPVGVLGYHAEHAADLAVVVRNRAVGEGVVGLLRVSAPLQEEEETLVPGGLPGADHLLDPGADLGPDLGPDVARGCFTPSVGA